MPQGQLPFNYALEFSRSGTTSLAGLPAYLELGHILGLGESIDRRMAIRSGGQGYTDGQVILPLVLMNLAGGDCVEDLARLEDDPGFRRVLEETENCHLPRKIRRKLKRRWRKQRTRTIPSASAVRRYLDRFCDPEEESKRGYGKAFIPAPTDGLLGLQAVNADLVAAVHRRTGETVLTLDLDATLVEVEKKEALRCYKGFLAFQPLNVWCAELEQMVHSEFRDGNVPASFDNLRVLQESLEMIPEGVEKIRFRSDTAAYQQDLLQYLAEGRHPRFGVIEFAVGVDVTSALKAEVARLEESEWAVLQKPNKKTGELEDTPYEWAEVVFVPNWVAHKKSNPDYRFIVTRKRLAQQPLPGVDDGQLEFDFPTMRMGSKGLYRLYAIVTNRTVPGDELIRWYRERCGKSEEAHDIQKRDLAGGRLPSKRFGSNAAWWAIMIVALNLNSAMRRLVLAPALGKSWLRKRLKAIRFWIIGLPGRVVDHARELWIRIGGEAALDRLRRIRERLAAIV
jgi:hypothetical protein